MNDPTNEPGGNGLKTENGKRRLDSSHWLNPRPKSPTEKSNRAGKTCSCGCSINKMTSNQWSLLWWGLPDTQTTRQEFLVALRQVLTKTEKPFFLILSVPYLAEVKIPNMRQNARQRVRWRFYPDHPPFSGPLPCFSSSWVTSKVEWGATLLFVSCLYCKPFSALFRINKQWFSIY